MHPGCTDPLLKKKVVDLLVHTQLWTSLESYCTFALIKQLEIINIYVNCKYVEPFIKIIRHAGIENGVKIVIVVPIYIEDINFGIKVSWKWVRDKIFKKFVREDRF